MKLIVGLGNPGKIYSDSRHNIGFLVVGALSKAYKISLKREKGSFALSGKGKIAGRNVVLATPITFMNLSGIAVNLLLKKNKVDLDNLLVVCDDLDLELSRLKIRAAGSSGGHRGLNSIIDFLKSEDFCRLRIGIGRPKEIKRDAAEYVLSPFSKKEKERVEKIIERAVRCCRVWASEGILESMNIFNRPVSLKTN